MALAVAFEDVWSDGRRIHAIGTITPSGNYAAGGEDLNIKGAAANGRGQAWRSPSDPMQVIITGKAGFVYLYDKAARKMLVYCNTAGGANAPLGEHTVAGYVAGVTGDTIRFYAVGKQLV
jgi:hypothetical protein